MTHLSLWLAKGLSSAFLGILFLQSGLDKVLDWRGNREYIDGYLAKTPLKRVSTLALLGITVLEVSAGVLSAAGCLAVVVLQSSSVALLGATLAGVSILSLFLGQRLAKDYAAAAGMVPYFLAALATVMVQGL